MQICPKCGKKEIESGSVVTSMTGHAAFSTKYNGVLYRAQESKQDKVANIFATTCLNCGHVELYLDPKQLK
jgi:predicted nucleic-acid-binding Zn-ribbon protein